MLSISDIEAKKVLVDRNLRGLEDDVAKRFDKRMDEAFEKLKILQL